MVPFADIPQEEANNGSPVNLDPAQTTDFPSFNSEEPSGEPEAPQEGRYAEETAYKRPGSRRRPANNQRFRPESRDKLDEISQFVFAAFDKDRNGYNFSFYSN